MTTPLVVRWNFEDYWASRYHQQSFIYTGTGQNFIVPDDITMLKIWARGARTGGILADGVPLGGWIKGYLPVTPGETLHIYVGDIGKRHNTWNGGDGGFNGGGDGGDATDHDFQGGDGGGGATDLRQGGTALTARKIVAAGAGGNSGGGRQGGPGGAATGAKGTGPRGGHGGTQTAGGEVGERDDDTAGHGDGSLGTGGTGKQASGHPRPNTLNAPGGGGAGKFGGGAGGWQEDPRVVLGGGGGSNDVSGFDQSQSVYSERGSIAYAVSDLRQAILVLSYAHEITDYTFHINPDAGGAVAMDKSIAMSQTLGPNRVNIMQEGNSQTPVLPFSGSILTQQHLEALEDWYDRKVFLKLTDDLGREYYGVFSKLSPRRIRRASNPWYHTFEAEFSVAAYRTASGDWRYGRIPD